MINKKKWNKNRKNWFQFEIKQKIVFKYIFSKQKENQLMLKNKTLWNETLQ